MLERLRYKDKIQYSGSTLNSTQKELGNMSRDKMKWESESRALASKVGEQEAEQQASLEQHSRQIAFLQQGMGHHQKQASIYATHAAVLTSEARQTAEDLTVVREELASSIARWENESAEENAQKDEDIARLRQEAAAWRDLGERQEMGLARAKLEALNAGLVKSQVERKLNAMHSDTLELEIAKAEAGKSAQARLKLVEHNAEMDSELAESRKEVMQMKTDMQRMEGEVRKLEKQALHASDDLQQSKLKFAASTTDADISRKVLQATTSKLLRAIPDGALEEVVDDWTTLGLLDAEVARLEVNKALQERSKKKKDGKGGKGGKGSEKPAKGARGEGRSASPSPARSSPARSESPAPRSKKAGAATPKGQPPTPPPAPASKGRMMVRDESPARKANATPNRERSASPRRADLTPPASRGGATRAAPRDAPPKTPAKQRDEPRTPVRQQPARNASPDVSRKQPARNQSPAAKKAPPAKGRGHSPDTHPPVHGHTPPVPKPN